MLFFLFVFIIKTVQGLRLLFSLLEKMTFPVNGGNFVLVTLVQTKRKEEFL